MASKSESCLILILSVFVIAGICFCLADPERFRADFTFTQRRGTNAVWENAKVVMVKNVATDLALTYIPRTGSVRLEPVDKSNSDQYWIYSTEGYIMNPSTEMCISYPTLTGTGNDGIGEDPLMNLCTEYAGQVFVYDKKTKKLINRTQMPYYTTQRPKLIKSLKMRCLSWYPKYWGIQRDLGMKRVAIVDCRDNDKAQEWEVMEMSIGEFKKAQEESYTTITSSNNPRNLYPTARIGEYNVEIEGETLRPRPYFKTMY